jgi:hypothetical protein
LIARFTVWAFQQLVDAANRKDWNYKKDCDETHALLHEKVCDRATVSALHRLRRLFRTPREEIRSDDYEGESHFFSCI